MQDLQIAQCLIKVSAPWLSIIHAINECILFGSVINEKKKHKVTQQKKSEDVDSLAEYNTNKKVKCIGCTQMCVRNSSFCTLYQSELHTESQIHILILTENTKEQDVTVSVHFVWFCTISLPVLVIWFAITFSCVTSFACVFVPVFFCSMSHLCFAKVLELPACLFKDFWNLHPRLHAFIQQLWHKGGLWKSLRCHSRHIHFNFDHDSIIYNKLEV